MVLVGSQRSKMNRERERVRVQVVSESPKKIKNRSGGMDNINRVVAGVVVVVGLASTKVEIDAHLSGTLHLLP